MKKYISKSNILFFVLSLFFAETLSAQKGQAYEMNIEGVKVIVQPSNNEIVEVLTVIKGGVQNYTLANQGIEALALNALTECGTLKDDKNSYKNKLDKVSARINGNAGQDFSRISLNCIKMDFDVVWPLYVDAITQPLFDQKEFDRIKQDAITNLRAQASQPDYAIGKMAKSIAFAGKDNEKSPEGTEASLKKITAEQAKAHYKNILTRSRITMVVVGEIDRSVLEEKIKSMLSSIPKGQPFSLKKQAYTPIGTTFKSEKKDLATNYIQAITGGPLPGSEDFNAFSLAMRIFADRHFLDVRSKNGLSYAPGSWFDGNASSSANISVSTTEPDKYIAVLRSLIDRTKKTGFDADEVKNWKTTYLTSFYYRLETNSAQAASLASNEVVHDNWRRALTFNNDIKKVSVAEVNEAFNKYISNLTWAYQGDPSKVNPILYTQAKTTKPAMPKSKVSTKKNG
ncbi:MAG: pitrilysin family protein [Chitinophagaceae bacterium]